MNWKKINIFKIHISIGDTEKKITKVKKLPKIEPKKFKQLTDKQKNEIKVLNRNNKTNAEIAESLGIAKSTVSYWLQKTFKTPEKIRRKQREGYQRHRIDRLRKCHQERIAKGDKLKDHDDCPVCFPDSKISLNDWIKRNKRIHYAQMIYAKTHKRKKIEIAKSCEDGLHIIDAPDGVRELIKPKIEMLQRTPPIKKGCFYPNCIEDAEHFLDSGNPMCNRHRKMYDEFHNM